MRQTYVYGDNRISVDKADKTGYYLYDGHGSVSGLISDNALLTNSYRYDSYGNLTSGSADAVNYYGYNAESSNVKTGLQYLRVRYYNTETGRFMSEDTERGTKENPLTRNQYIYVLNNPLNYCDPKGLFFKEIFAGVKKAAKKVGNWVNKNIVQPVKRAFTAVADVAKKAYSAVKKAVSNWWDDTTTAPSNYHDSRNGTGATGGGSYSAMDIQEKAVYMTDHEIGQLENGWGLSGSSLQRYLKQKTEVIVAKVQRVLCSPEARKAIQKAKTVAIIGKTAVVTFAKAYPAMKSVDPLLGAAPPDIEISLKDKLQLVLGAVEVIGGAAGIAGSGAGTVVSGGAAVGVAAGTATGSLALAGAGIATIGNAVGNIISNNKGNNSGGGKGESETKPLKGKGADKAAADLGYSKTNYKSHGQPVYKKGNKYITPDVDAHNGGVWKMADSVKNLGSKSTRMGTYDSNLIRIGD